MRVNPSKTSDLGPVMHSPMVNMNYRLQIHINYLCYILYEHLSNTRHVKVMTGSASRSFGRVYNIFKTIQKIWATKPMKPYIIPI